MENEKVSCTIFKDSLERTYELINMVEPDCIEDFDSEVVKIPFWLAAKLQENDMIIIGLPPVINKDIINKLEAGSSVVNMSSVHKNFFDLAIFSKAYTDDILDFEEVIENSRLERFHKVLDIAQASGAQYATDFKKGLTKKELLEFNLKQRCEENYMKWKKSYTLKEYHNLKQFDVVRN